MENVKAAHPEDKPRFSETLPAVGEDVDTLARKQEVMIDFPLFTSDVAQWMLLQNR